MGQCVRIDRARRFAHHLESVVNPRIDVKPGDTLTVVSVGIGSREASGEEVVVYAGVETAGGERFDVELSQYGVLFDPEGDDPGDPMGALSLIGIPITEIVAGLERAELFPGVDLDKVAREHEELQQEIASAQGQEEAGSG